MFIEAKDDGGCGVNSTTGAISHTKLQSNHHHQQTNIQFFFTGRMPFLSPNQQRQSTEGKISHSMDLLTPSSPGGLPTLSLTTNSSWLPWRRFAMPLISPLMPVLLVLFLYCCINIFYIPVVVDIVVVVVVKSITVLLLIMMHKLRMCSEPRHCSM